jgi:hypothetical protein
MVSLLNHLLLVGCVVLTFRVAPVCDDAGDDADTGADVFVVSSIVLVLCAIEEEDELAVATRSTSSR